MITRKPRPGKKHVLMKKFIPTSCLPVERVLEKGFSYEQYSVWLLWNQAENDQLPEKNFSGRFVKIFIDSFR
ncbi:hypothetical protein ACFL03_05430 [Thermodesulfobacteriota bacterium]